MKEGIFGSVPMTNWKSSKFDLTHDVKLTGNMGNLIPVLCEEVLPGDNWRWKGNLLIRFAPLLAPVMHRVKATMHAFHVANRTLNTNWKESITGGQDGESTERSSYIVMKEFLETLNGDGQATWDRVVGTSSLWDYIGLPVLPFQTAPHTYDDQTEVNILPFLAYTQIWQYYYKDQNVDSNMQMIEPIAGDFMIGVNAYTYMTLRKRAWQKDAFTSALPWPQRGADVLVPFQSVVDTIYSKVTGLPNTQGGDLIAANGTVGGEIIMVNAGAVPQVEFRGTNATFTVNDLRTAIVVQQWLELSARGGQRYNEFVLSQYNTVVPDYRIDQPEYIGGGTQFVNFSEVLTTANSQDADDNTIPPATMTGHGISVGSHNTFNYAVKEHGWIFVILSVMPETNYQQGIPRKFTRNDRLDYAYPLFAGLGEQEILSKEIYYDPDDTTAVNDTLFGYQQRFWEYKHIQNRTCGEFKTTLNYWTMTRIFATRPDPVDTAFIYSDPTTRIFAVEDASDKLWMQVIHELSVTRKLPYYSVPGVNKI